MARFSCQILSPVCNLLRTYFVVTVFAGRPSKEEKEIRGCAGGGKGRPVSDGHSSGNRSYLQHSQGGSAMYPGKCHTCRGNFTKSRMSHFLPQLFTQTIILTQSPHYFHVYQCYFLFRDFFCDHLPGWRPQWRGKLC